MSITMSTPPLDSLSRETAFGIYNKNNLRVVVRLEAGLDHLELSYPNQCLGKKQRSDFNIPFDHIISCKCIPKSHALSQLKGLQCLKHCSMAERKRKTKRKLAQGIANPENTDNNPTSPNDEHTKETLLLLTYYVTTLDGSGASLSPPEPESRETTGEIKSENHDSSSGEEELTGSSVRYKVRTLVLKSLPRDSKRDDTIKEWEQALRQCMGITMPKRPLLILVNPKSGVGTALSIFEDVVGPILDEADVPYDMVLTTRSGYGQDLVVNEDLERWSGIVIISGDGLLYEVVQGLFKRPDWAKVSKMPMTIIAGGSGNGLARTLAHESGDSYQNSGILPSAMSLVRRRIRTMDICFVQTASGKNAYAFLSIGWGFMADCDIESETLRFIGEPRFALWSLWRTANLRHYRGRLSYKQVQPRESKESAPIDRSTLVEEALPGEWSPREDYKSANGMPVHTTPEFTLPPLDEPVPSDWTVVEDDFIMVYATNTAFIATLLRPTPEARIDDGTIWLLILKKGVSKWGMLQILMAIERGTHTELPGVEIVPVSAFRLEPLNKSGYIVVDGEMIDYEPLQAQVLPSYFNIMTK